ncbi:hypothetical protein RCG17_24435 [Neobacillus sp. PS3-12]|uniref:hypothetical protein n=1 Tax=Neobacillus sp. PS3-12 TaxID=3070677 RepID=UPI0027E0F027|nr:hypothetical protein [Neobacillus sp. PS3-12]WML52483.1 hypothetical protein RCG17_24435 [Neobacillus sp. PS3-12]
MKNFFKKAGEVLKEGSIEISIISGMFSAILDCQTEKIEAEGIYDVKVVFKENYLEVTGYAKKLLLKIPFKIEFTPYAAEQRVMKFEIRNMTPLNQDWIKRNYLISRLL